MDTKAMALGQVTKLATGALEETEEYNNPAVSRYFLLTLETALQHGASLADVVRAVRGDA